MRLERAVRPQPKQPVAHEIAHVVVGEDAHYLDLRLEARKVLLHAQELLIRTIACDARVHDLSGGARGKVSREMIAAFVPDLKRGPVMLLDSPIIPTVAALGPDAAQVIYSNRNKDYSQQGWTPMIGAFFNRGLMLLDFDEHMYHRRIMQEAFVRTRLAGYTEQVDKVVSQVIASDWVANDPRFLLYPAMKELTLDIASMVFMGHEPGTDRELVTKVNKAFTVTTRAGNAIIRTSVPDQSRIMLRITRRV